MKQIGKLHVLTDFSFQQKHSHAELARMAIQGGADTIQFRQKHGSIRDFLESARAVQAVCSELGITLLVNDRVDVAVAVGAGGVHLGQEDLPVADARRVLGPDAIIGVTTPSLSLARKAIEGGADYVGFGPVFPTKSKSNTVAVQGLDGLAAFCSSVSIPVIAIAGITVERCLEVMEAGAYGVAIMTAISLAQYPEIEAQKFALAVRG